MSEMMRSKPCFGDYDIIRLLRSKDIEINWETPGEVFTYGVNEAKILRNDRKAFVLALQNADFNLVGIIANWYGGLPAGSEDDSSPYPYVYTWEL